MWAEIIYTIILSQSLSYLENFYSNLCLIYKSFYFNFIIICNYWKIYSLLFFPKYLQPFCQNYFYKILYFINILLINFDIIWQILGNK